MNVCRENRELSWLKFNDRVLMQAKDPQVPLAEKLSFISIYQTNLDEFFMVRIGSLYDQMLFYPDSKDNKTGMTGLEQLKACLKKVHYLNKKKDRIYENVMSELGQSGWSVIKYKDIEAKKTAVILLIILKENYYHLFHHKLFLKDNHFHLSTIVKCMSLYILNRKKVKGKWELFLVLMRWMKD